MTEDRLLFLWECFIGDTIIKNQIVQIVDFYENMCFYEALWNVFEQDEIHYAHIMDVDLRMPSDDPFGSPLADLTIEIEQKDL